MHLLKWRLIAKSCGVDSVMCRRLLCGRLACSQVCVCVENWFAVGCVQSFGVLSAVCGQLVCSRLVCSQLCVD